MEKLLKIINDLPKNKPLIIGIDGRCAAGKTTLAADLKAETGCAVFHMDDFFLRPEQRTEERLQTAGENVDHERFLEEVLLPLKSGKNPIVYRHYDCQKQALCGEISMQTAAVNIVEGSYSLHPSLWEFYDLRIFLTVAPEEQMQRIIIRNGREKAEVFRERWIPLEEKYFSAFDIENRCDIRMKTY
ncbi:MAG: uridine kinase [Oscillospiraceae bacterium]|nr:uridine kinase [Oscillospiraceae bacterium]